MGKSGMSRRAYTDADPTFAEALGRMRKEERTMAEKREEEGALSREAILSLCRVKEALDTDLPRKAGRVLRQARQAKTAEELDAVEDALTDLEIALRNKADACCFARHRAGAAKVDLMPRPEGEHE